jgi:flagellar basal-body rod protein FlgF
MDKMVYVAASGGTTILRAQTLVTNNIANVNTDGFRADLARFSDSEINGPGYRSRVNSVAQGVGFDHSPGSLVSTGRELDVAVQGSGWIAVQEADGSEAYTRGGSLNVNGVGLLETRDGLLVLGDNGPLAVPAHNDIMLGNDGTVSIIPEGQDANTLAEIGRIKLVDPDPQTLLKRYDGLVQVVGGTPAAADAAVRLNAGFVESSNVNIAETMVSMIELSRQFEIQTRLMQAADENANRASQIVRVN